MIWATYAMIYSAKLSFIFYCKNLIFRKKKSKKKEAANQHHEVNMAENLVGEPG